MTDNTEQETKRPLSLVRPGGKLELRKPIETGQVRQSFPHGRSKTVQVEVRKKRAVTPGEAGDIAVAKETAPPTTAAATAPAATPAARSSATSR
jgi:translation initiation factor IF-2